jgi:hypothetical protein
MMSLNSRTTQQTMTMNQQVKLTSTITVADYLRMLEEGNKSKGDLAVFIEQRFTERYITSLQDNRRNKNGFCMMSVSCLIIESLESFWQGWPNTERRSEQAFRSFFDRNTSFSVFRGHASDFYKNVRCGILHQAETCGGWKIRRSGSLCDVPSKTINAARFHKQIRSSLYNYRKVLETSPWDSDVWNKFRKKMEAVCDNCG